jgi:hypothetical protein
LSKIAETCISTTRSETPKPSAMVRFERADATKLPYINLAFLDLSPSLESLRASPRFAEMRAQTAERIGHLLRF